MVLSPEGNSLEPFPEGHPVSPPEMATRSRLVLSVRFCRLAQGPLRQH